MPEQAVVELRRTAPKYVDVRGSIAQDLLDQYSTFTMEQAPVPLLESISMETSDKAVRGAVNGQHVVFQWTKRVDAARFEVEARAFLKTAEKRILPDSYERVGVLYSFISTSSFSFEDWAEGNIGLSTRLVSFSVEDAQLRYEGGTYGNWRQTVMVSRANPPLDREAKTAIRFDVDQYQLEVGRQEALNLNLRDLYIEAINLVETFTGDDSHDS